MVFSSPVFLFLFLPIVLLLVMSAGTLKARNTILTFASLFFYAWGETFYVWVMLTSILMNYLAGLWLGTARTPQGRKVAIVAGVSANLGLLLWFKYANFFAEDLSAVLHVLGIGFPALDHVDLPLGISFFTFQGLSYLIDVYRNEVPAQRQLGKLALYKSLFPQLIAGPIVRYRDVSTELDERSVTMHDFAIGVRRFIIGLGKKLLIADNVAHVADTIFALPDGAMPASVAWLGGLAYTVQIYFDFSGYSDMAIGLGRMFGFHFLENFNFPFIARSVREFWQRWHISLTTWFRDYVYIPLGGSRGGTFSTYRNLLSIFFLTGLWHGASWNFVCWGLFHGLFLVIERLGLDRVLARIPHLIGTAYMLIVLQFSWALFHTEDLHSAWNFARSLVGLHPDPGMHLYASVYLSTEVVLCLVLGALCSTPLLRMTLAWARARSTHWRKGLRNTVRQCYTAADLAVHIVILLFCCMHLASSTYDPFIYFRF
jgi:alginate O-acetyltransferase complex protein AlgI